MGKRMEHSRNKFLVTALSAFYSLDVYVWDNYVKA